VPYQITATNTCWVFVSGSTDARHFLDIVYGVTCLKKQGVQDNDIFVFHDFDAAQATPKLNANGIAPRLFAPADLAVELAQLAGYEHLVLATSGHGQLEGLSTVPPISPHGLYAAVRGAPVSLGIIVLGQCQAGVFHFTDALTAPPLVVIGATNLSLSLSTTMVGFSVATGGWSANAFLAYFFQWLGAPVDVDGDGKHTLLDAYKFAGVRTGELLPFAKVRQGKDLPAKLQQVDALQVQHAADWMKLLTTPAQNLSPAEQQTQMTITAAIKDLTEAASIVYMSQEPWLLNANLIRDVSFW
jgi:hypothetical protein